MAHFNLKRTVPTDDRSGARGSYPLGEPVDLPPVYFEIQRMEVALAGSRHRLPAGANTPEAVCSFLDSLAEDVK